MTPPPWDATNPPDGTSVESATVSADGRTLTVRFVGASDKPGDPCGADYTARADESDTAIVAIVEAHPRAGSHCRPATVSRCAWSYPGGAASGGSSGSTGSS